MHLHGVARSWAQGQLYLTPTLTLTLPYLRTRDVRSSNLDSAAGYPEISSWFSSPDIPG